MYLSITIILFILELLYFRIAKIYNILDKPNERSLHKKVTIRGGGIIFLVSVLFYFVYSKIDFTRTKLNLYFVLIGLWS
jgi:UDP-GlcNAc:undecaprenyl-phosphate/decaprenyl-phosphate GlcNAc-1-phosphate transferase